MVSIIVTTYNYAHFLSETLASVKNQSFQNWECIVVDSGSKDNTADLMNTIVSEDSRIKFIRQANLGVSAARNTGIKSASGNFLQFLDGDDLLQSNKLASQLKCFECKPEADIIYSDIRFFDEGKKDQLRYSLTGLKPADWLPKVSGRRQEVLKHLSRFNFLVTHAPLLRRSVIDGTGLFNEAMHGMEDWDFWLRCALNNSFFHYCDGDQAMALVRVHSTSLSRNKESMLHGNFLLLENALRSEKTGFTYRVLFMIKYSSLFWESLFAGKHLPSFRFMLLFISVLFFPFWCIIKFARMIKLF